MLPFQEQEKSAFFLSWSLYFMKRSPITKSWCKVYSSTFLNSCLRLPTSSLVLGPVPALPSCQLSPSDLEASCFYWKELSVLTMSNTKYPILCLSPRSLDESRTAQLPALLPNPNSINMFKQHKQTNKQSSKHYIFDLVWFHVWKQTTYSTNFNMLLIIFFHCKRPFSTCGQLVGVKIYLEFPPLEKFKWQKQGPNLYIHTNTNTDKRHTIFVLMLSPPFGIALWVSKMCLIHLIYAHSVSCQI